MEISRDLGICRAGALGVHREQGADMTHIMNESDPVADAAFPRIGQVDPSLPLPPIEGTGDHEEAYQLEPEQEDDR